jgi:hypothetical protein
MSKYRKLYAALVGLAVIYLNKRYGIDLFGTEDFFVEILDVALSTGTALAVWAIPNAQPEAPKCSHCSGS